MGRSNWHLPGKSVLITGAAGGIGSVTARLLASGQTHLLLVDVRGDALRQQTLAFGGEALCREVDITKRDPLDAAVTATLSDLGGLMW